MKRFTWGPDMFVQDLVWIGRQLVLCLRHSYKVIKADGVRDLLEPNTTPMCTALASANVAALLWEVNGSAHDVSRLCDWHL